MKAHAQNSSMPIRPVSNVSSVAGASFDAAAADAIGPETLRPARGGSGSIVVTWAEYQRQLPVGSSELRADGREAMPEAGEPMVRASRQHTETTVVLGFINEPMN
jgi:hypothetical protein